MDADKYKHHSQKLFRFIDAAKTPDDLKRISTKPKKTKSSISNFKTDPTFLRTSTGLSPDANPTENAKVIAWLMGATGYPRKKQLISRLKQYDTLKLDLHYILDLLMWARSETLPSSQKLTKKTFQRVLAFYNESMALPGERVPDAVLKKLALYFGNWIVVNPHTIMRERSKPGLIEPQARLFSYFLQKQVSTDEKAAICEVCDVLWDASACKKPTAQHVASTKTLIYRFINAVLGYDPKNAARKKLPNSPR